LSLQQINQSLQSRLDASDRQLAVLASQTIPLAGQEAAPSASGALYVGQGESVLVLSGLDVLPESQTYQLWLIPADGAPVPSGLLALRQPDVDSLTVTLPDAPANYAAVGVSIEPAGGSAEPTGPIVLVGLTRS
jgi:anti-sigma-K factor RskA